MAKKGRWIWDAHDHKYVWYVYDTPPPHSTSSSNHPLGSGSGSPAGGAFDLSGFTAGAVAEAEQEVNDFASWLGWPKWFNFNQMVKALLQINLQADANQAYQFLWTQLSKDQQAANQNAYFGLTKQQYTEKLNNLTDMYELYTGGTKISDTLRNQALRENWTQSELLANLEKDPTISANAPWIFAGQTFRDVQSQFTQTYGSPASGGAKMLASWWKFRAGAQTVAPTGGAIEQAMPPPPLVSRQLAADVATR